MEGNFGWQTSAVVIGPIRAAFCLGLLFHGLSFVSAGAKVSVFSSHLVIDIAATAVLK